MIYIAKLVHAGVENSTFSKCRIPNENRSTATVKNYILGLSDATEKNTTFDQCSASQRTSATKFYNASTWGTYNESFHNKGEIEME
jgi:hypothetical protein